MISRGVGEAKARGRDEQSSLLILTIRPLLVLGHGGWDARSPTHQKT